MADKQPKVILFDIGGVCVSSPFQAILDYELGLGIPPGWVNYSISRTAPNGFWHRLERGSIPMDDRFFTGFTKDLRDPDRWEAFYKAAQERSRGTINELPEQVPPVPEVAGERLFGEMMASADVPDPWIFPAIKALKASGRYILAALSNTVIFPPGHSLHCEDFFAHPLRAVFDVFVSSAHVGLRKPEPKMYRLALREVDRYARANAESPSGKANGWKDGVAAEDVVFLDDIGENLRAAKQHGFRTIKVHLGRAYEAVDALEDITGSVDETVSSTTRPSASVSMETKRQIQHLDNGADADD
ncbi:haloacid dehalogenase-like hydrolase [Grosmannia clavigera kw1407]|uniref:Haloacid dehalogenase-like hydrolase n=1 Tax=Grosmannia clavigera (strain kw1407 / UAMH 11150) TaxID=655863 RepID=F0XC10_GROCL|nr:haloacid dehalogenase-like hydrolase [Grosmannia clavigera kw1407]EFX04510.1 haloacid dehalogenase-like hydrolase [Grosmannia clavigera kw1407]